ncbi:MAG: DUF7718 family protein [Sciscionella sp.]
MAEGAFSHPPCPQCEQPPARREYLDPTTRWVVRLRHCEDHLVDFAVVLQMNTAMGWRDVTRFSVAHSNFHQYRYSWNTRYNHRRELGLLNTVEDVEQAYTQVTNWAYTQVEQFVSDWREGL